MQLALNSRFVAIESPDEACISNLQDIRASYGPELK